MEELMAGLRRQDLVKFQAEESEISFIGYLDRKKRMAEQCKLRTGIE